jgi:hypothetical protein
MPMCFSFITRSSNTYSLPTLTQDNVNITLAQVLSDSQLLMLFPTIEASALNMKMADSLNVEDCNYTMYLITAFDLKTPA